MQTLSLPAQTETEHNLNDQKQDLSSWFKTKSQRALSCPEYQHKASVSASQHRPHLVFVGRHTSTGILLSCFWNLEAMLWSPLLLLLQLFHFCLHRGTFQREEVLPLRLKNSREYFPDRAKCLGILPSSSMMWAMWSMRREKKKDIGMGRAKGRMG